MCTTTDSLRSIAEQAGISVPEDQHKYETSDYMKWFVFVNMQLACAKFITPTHDTLVANANFISSYREEVLVHTPPSQLIAEGFKL